MKKKNLVLFISIGLLAILPFIRVSVAAPPCWVGVYEDEFYMWHYATDSDALAGAWTTDDVVTLGYFELGVVMTWGEDNDAYGLLPGNMTHEITTVEDLAPDVEYGTNYQSVQIINALVFNTTYFGYDYADKDTGLNVYNGLVIENSTEFVLFHDGLLTFFDAYQWPFTSTWASTNTDWGEVVTAANTELAATDATVTVVTDGTEEVGFKITVAALAWTTNTQALVLEVTFEDGLLNTYDLTYGGDNILSVDLLTGSSQYVACPPPSDAIPGYELPIIIGVVSILSLILIKKLKNK